jgi:hypothetical protein
MIIVKRLLPLLVGAAQTALVAQTDLYIEGKPVQIHGFVSQSFLKSSGNNYLTMDTRTGSAAFTDGGANASVMLTSRLRVGAQIYLRNVGELGNWHPILDWGVVDYHFKDWFGLRGGKVKTTLGLFNDTQDNAFLHTWALLPQSIYPLDLRGSNLAHTGADAYGTIPVKHLGHLEYTIYGGRRAFDTHGGYPYSLNSELSYPAGEFRLLSQSGRVIGEDLRLVTKIGLTIGASHNDLTYGNRGHGDPGNVFAGDTRAEGDHNFANAFYFDYSPSRFRFFGEYSRTWKDDRILLNVPGAGEVPVFRSIANQKSWYAAFTYRVHPKLELGTYYSRFHSKSFAYVWLPTSHLFDKTVTARIDMNSHWDLKVEGHFMDGAPSGFDLRGFYTTVNPNGLVNDTRLLIVRSGFVF